MKLTQNRHRPKNYEMTTFFFFEMTTFKQLFNYISHAQNLKDIENLKI